MTKTVSSECSSLSDIDYDPITSTFAKLRAVIDQEASLRKELDKLFIKRTEEAHIAVQNAQNHLEMVKSQEANMREILKTESTAANEMIDSASNIGLEDTAGPAELERLKEVTVIIEHRHEDAAEKLRQEQEESDRLAKLEEDRLAELERDILAREEEHRLAAQEATRITAAEARRQDEAERRQLDEERQAKEEEDRIQEAAIVEKNPVVRVPTKKKKGKKVKETKETPAAVMEEPPNSPARSTHAFELPRSPARLAYGLDPTRSPARPACELNGSPVPISLTRSSRGIPSDTPPRSPARSTRGFEDTYLSPDATGYCHMSPGKTRNSPPSFSFGDNYGSGIEEPKNSPARLPAALPTTFALGGGGFGASKPNNGFGFGGKSPTIHFGLRPHHSTFSPNISSFRATTHPTQAPAAADDVGGSNKLFDDVMKEITAGEDWGFEIPADEDDAADASYEVAGVQSPKAVANDYLGEQLDSGYKHDDVGVSGSGANEGLDGEFAILNGQDHVQTSPAREPSPVPAPPEEPSVVVVAPKKKKKAKKVKEAPAADFLFSEKPTSNANNDEGALMEIKLSEEDKLEAELRQLEAEQDRREEARLIAETAEDEHLGRELRDAERQRMVLEEGSEYCYYLSLKEAAEMAEERLSMVQAELDALEAQKLVILQQAESAREQEANCRYHEIMRSR